MQKGKLEKSIVELVEIMKKLRSPDGCPWDREQTYSSLERYIIEEAYEVVEAIESGDPEHIKDELGDLLLQVVFQAQIARENDDFNIIDVIEGVSEKMIRRHPHVFSDTTVESVDEVMVNWESIKDEEKKESLEESKLIMDNLSREQPALIQAEEIQNRAADVGFDWPEITGVIAKIEEEFFETREALEAGNSGMLEEEIGDLLFSVVNLSRFCDINAETALYKTVLKFKQRFKLMEKYAKDENLRLDDNLSLERLESFWERAKNEYSREE